MSAASDTDTFARTAHKILVTEKRRPVQEVARALNMKYATFYSRIKGRVPFAPEEIRALLREVPDVRLVDALLTGTGFRAVSRLAGDGSSDLLREAARAIKEAANALWEVQSAFSADDLSPEGRQRAIEYVSAAERALASVRDHLQRPGMGPAPAITRRGLHSGDGRADRVPHEE